MYDINVMRLYKLSCDTEILLYEMNIEYVKENTS
jgi:hypothetical protein